MKIALLQHLIEYGALAFDGEHRLVVTDDILLAEGLALLGIASDVDLITYLATN